MPHEAAEGSNAALVELLLDYRPMMNLINSIIASILVVHYIGIGIYPMEN
jgi:hypothetical protein